MQIQTSADVVSSTRTTSISVSDSRKGKTHFIGTMADHGKLFVIDVECGLSTITDKKFDFVTVHNWKEIEEALEWYMLEGQKTYTHLAIDSITRIQSYLKEYLIQEPDSHKKNKGVMTMGKYDTLAIKLRKIVDVLTKQCTSSIHMTAMAQEEKDKLTGAVKIFPNLQGGFKFDLVGYFDTILYNQMGLDAKGNPAYWCEIAGTERNCAGTRLQKVKQAYPKVMPNDYTCIVNALKE